MFLKDSNRNTYSLFKMKKRRSRKYPQVYHFKHNYSISIDKKVRYHRIFQLRDSKVDVSYLQGSVTPLEPISLPETNMCIGLW